jgi:hypothetical protein
MRLRADPKMCCWRPVGVGAADRTWGKNLVTCGKSSVAMVVCMTAPRVVAEVDQNDKMELKMHVLRLMGGVGLALVVVGAQFGVAVLGAGEASADGPVQLRSRLGDFCLDAPGGSWVTAVVINPCNGTDFQRWNLTPAGQLESVAFPGLCLSTPGERWWVHLEACVDWFTQKWTIQPNGLVTASSVACLTVLGGPGPGTWVSTGACNAGAPDQEWDSVP